MSAIATVSASKGVSAEQALEWANRIAATALLVEQHSGRLPRDERIERAYSAGMRRMAADLVAELRSHGVLHS